MESKSIKRAVILAAGQGERISSVSEALNKSLLPLGSATIIDHICEALESVNIQEILLVTGFSPENLENHFKERPLKSARLRPIHNSIWQKGNGTSLWAARDILCERGNPFLVLMSDHIFDPEALSRLFKAQSQTQDSLLCTDASFDPDIDIDDATKVFIEPDGKTRKIDKKLSNYNAIDCGIFSLQCDVFEGLRISMDQGEYSLSGGVRFLANQSKLSSVDISGVIWQDIDTETDLNAAQKKIVRIQEDH